VRRRELPNFQVQPLAGGLLNLISVIPEQLMIVVGAHYDTSDHPDFVGANDGPPAPRPWSSHEGPPRVAAEGPPRVRLVLFDGEEDRRLP
jgi:hypothetical protein